MKKSGRLRPAYIDVLSNTPKSDQGKRQIEALLNEEFAKDLPQSVDRLLDLPPILVEARRPEYIALLTEARALFVAGHFYACVAMCGIVGERILMDRARDFVFVKGKKPMMVVPLPEEAASELEYLGTNRLIGFLVSAGALDESAAKSARRLSDLRNTYAHARGKDPHSDSRSAIKWLHELIDGTVSLMGSVQGPPSSPTADAGVGPTSPKGPLPKGT